MTRVLLLGAQGFIGRHVAAAMDHSTRVDTVVPAGRTDLDLLHPTRHAVEDLLTRVQPDVVVNCSGMLDGSPEALLTIHALGTAVLLDAIQAHRRPVRLVRIGSAGEYGSVSHGVRIDEEHPANPTSSYGISHLAATLLIRAASLSGRVDATTLRVFNPIGAGAGRETVLVRAAELFLQAEREGSLEVTMGPLGAWRDMIDVRDVAGAVLSAATVASGLPPIINIGTGRAERVRRAVEELRYVTGYPGVILESGEGAERSAGIAWTCADNGLATRTLNWLPRRTLLEAVASLWQEIARTEANR